MEQVSENVNLRRMREQLEDMHNKINKFEMVMSKTATAGHKFEKEYKFIADLKDALISIGLKVQRSESHSMSQHKRLIKVEEKLGLRKKPAKKGHVKKGDTTDPAKEEKNELGSEVPTSDNKGN